MITPTRPINILLVEDNPGDIRLTEEAFKEAEISVKLKAVMDGEEALNYLYKKVPYDSIQLPDLILLDLNLPKVDGRAVLADIKSNPELKKIPVIILTTSTAEQDILNSYDLHVNCYITKPVDFDRFFDIIKLIEDFWINTAILPSMV